MCLALAAQPAGARGDPAETARAAAEALREAGRSLEAVDSAGDRVAALTRTIRAYEAGLAALREGLRRAALREQVVAATLDAREAEVSRLLGALLALPHSPDTMMVHPAGPLGTARAGMLLGEVAPVLQAEADVLAAELREVALMRALQESAADSLAEGLAGVQRARTDLSQAMSERRDLPRRLAADPGALRRLLESSDTLDGFAAGLAEMPGSAPEAIASADFGALRGRVPLPVAGSALRGFDEPDAAGIARPGLVLATRPLALVTTPVPATIRYRGPLLDYGNVMILEPAEDYLLVLAGLSQVYGDAGDVLTAGSPVGLMGGADPEAAAFLDAASDRGGDVRTETLYMELRQGGSPVDPTPWFATDQGLRKP
ncbi:murein hydrolase activator EnvC [Rhodovulum sp. ES.010]|uniref:murein hydrolase activator EnvC family protein n=1 Tax=Rhodovulum sp. ES.010 TaxID=1882821 RepID=UPI0009408F89|nr:peptidoglycan DD-metalloendopeptidase family protein [Rhodovulum sp. ES.010]